MPHGQMATMEMRVERPARLRHVWSDAARGGNGGQQCLATGQCRVVQHGMKFCFGFCVSRGMITASTLRGAAL